MTQSSFPCHSQKLFCVCVFVQASKVFLTDPGSAQVIYDDNFLSSFITLSDIIYSYLSHSLTVSVVFTMYHLLGLTSQSHVCVCTTKHI